MKDAGGNFLEKFIYISAPNFSLQRRDANSADYTSANWAEHASGNSVGFTNVFENSTQEQTTTTPSTPPASQTGGGSAPQIILELPVQNLSPIKINEFVSDPESGNEWIELYNTSVSSFDLAGTVICDNRNTTSTCKKISGAVGPNGWLFVDLQTKSFLNNSGDSVIFKDAQGSVIDRIDYADELIPDEGQSLARKMDGADSDSDSDWVVTNKITPGAANIIQEESKADEPSEKAENATTTVKTKSVFIWKIDAPSSAAPNEVIKFNVEETADPRGGLIFFSWDLGDGKKIYGSEASGSFATSGVFDVIIFATSTSGYSEQKTIQITVGNGLSLNADIVISEVFPNPDGDDAGEFIELKNNSASHVNLSGWFLRVKDKKYIFPENTIIPPAGFLVFYKSVTKFSLLNTSGKIELLNKDKSLVDLIKYDKPQEGKSYGLINGEWKWINGTPGKENSSAAASVKKEEAKKAAAKKTSAKIYKFVNSIEAARGAEKGTSARVRGVVSVLPGNLGVQYLYIQNNGVGIQIFQSKKDFPALNVGDYVEVDGKVSIANGAKRINIKNKSAIDILATRKIVSTTALSLDELDEGLVGTLVKISGEITEIKNNFMYVDDGADEAVVYFKKGAKINKKKFQEGENVEIVGVLEQAKTGLQVWPRSQNDLISLGPSEDLLKKQAVINAKSEGDTAEKYLTATAGGVTTLLLGFFMRARGALVVGGLKKIAGIFIKKG